MTVVNGQVTAAINVTFNQYVLADINTHWLQQIAGTAGTLSAAMAATDTTFTITGNPTLAVGTALLIESEPMTVTAVNSTTGLITVTRGVSQTTPQGPAQFPLAVAAAHASGVTVKTLTYASPWAMIVLEALLPWGWRVTQNLGITSSVYGSTATGSVV